jgi:hypothetical protein
MQLKLDFSDSKLIVMDDSKKVTAGFRIGEKFKAELEEVVKARRLKDLSELINLYVIEGYSKDYHEILIAQMNQHKTVGELLSR